MRRTIVAISTLVHIGISKFKIYLTKFEVFRFAALFISAISGANSFSSSCRYEARYFGIGFSKAASWPPQST